MESIVYQKMCHNTIIACHVVNRICILNKKAVSYHHITLVDVLTGNVRKQETRSIKVSRKENEWSRRWNTSSNDCDGLGWKVKNGSDITRTTSSKCIKLGSHQEQKNKRPQNEYISTSSEHENNTRPDYQIPLYLKHGGKKYTKTRKYTNNCKYKADLWFRLQHLFDMCWATYKAQG